MKHTAARLKHAAWYLLRKRSSLQRGGGRVLKYAVASLHYNLLGKSNAE